MKKISLIFILTLFTIRGVAQLRTDAQSIFKMYLFLGRVNVDFKGIDKKVSKNDSLYKVFSGVISLNLDTLKIIKNSFNGEQSIPKFSFYELLIYDSVKMDYTENVTYQRRLDASEDQFFGIPVGGSNGYIIAINQVTGKSYRLKGFDTNDFLTFLSDFKEEYNKGEKKSLPTRRFLNLYKVEKLNFECLYKGLTAKEIYRDKCPCLKRTGDIASVK